MSTKDKLIKRLKSVPKDFTWEELVRLLSSLGFEESDKGRTSGSRKAFIRGSVVFALHRPHPGNILKEYQIKQIIRKLTAEGLI